MADLSELYQQVIIEHNRSPRNYRRVSDATHTAHGDNPLCGDHIDVFLRMEGDRIADVGFQDAGAQGRGCAISRASASLMTAAVHGKTAAEAQRLFGAVHAMLTGAPGGGAEAALGKLVALSGVRQFPSRVKCASLSWHALRAALAGEPTPVTTDSPAD
ncbi:MAG: Fe-S cluster assembly sulfur transfer protein SufU [Gemmatimonadales bacterium]